jgi:hypothetical protein
MINIIKKIMLKNKKIFLISVVVLIIAIVFVAAIASKDIRKYLRTYIAFPYPTPSSSPFSAEEETPFPPNFAEEFQNNCSGFVKNGFQGDLQKGSCGGQDVLCWQMTLNLLNIYGDILPGEEYRTGIGSLGRETAYFDDRTQSATLGLQYLANIPETGELDATTRETIKRDFFDTLVSEGTITQASKSKISLIKTVSAQGVLIEEGIRAGVKKVVGDWRSARNNNDCWDRDNGPDADVEGWTLSRFVFESDDERQREQFFQEGRDNLSTIFPPFVEYKSYKDPKTGEVFKSDPDVKDGRYPPALRVDKCADSTHVKEWDCFSKKITRYKDMDEDNKPKNDKTASDTGLRGIAASQVLECSSGKVCKETNMEISYKVGNWGLGAKTTVVKKKEDVAACVNASPSPSPSSTPTPTPTPTSTPTSTPTPTPTPISPSPTPTPTPISPSPTPTPTPAASPSPSSSPTPSLSPTPSSTPSAIRGVENQLARITTAINSLVEKIKGLFTGQR